MKRNKSIGGLLSFNVANLTAAKLMLGDRARYDRPDSRGVITWPKRSYDTSNGTEFALPVNSI